MPRARRTRLPSPTAAETLCQSQRLDKWLWHARITKTRGEAARLIEAGQVRLNRVKVSKPATLVRIGDVLTITHRARVRVWRVAGFSARRVSAQLAANLREEL